MKLEWKEIEVNGLVYFISNYGDVKSIRNFLKIRLDKDGYPTVTLGKKSKRKSMKVHKLVAMLFVSGKQENYEVNHKDFNRLNNRADNLEWMSHSENVRYSRKYNSSAFKSILGENNIKCRLAESDVLEIRKMIEDGWRTFEIAKKYNIGWSTVYNIKIRNTWKHI